MSTKVISLKRAQFNDAPEPVVEAGVMSYRRSKAVPKRTKAPLVGNYTFDSSRASPNLGETVAILHRTQKDKGGNAKTVRSDVDFRTIRAIFMPDSDGYTIKDSVGETWLVRPATQGSAKWETYVPQVKNHG